MFDKLLYILACLALPLIWGWLVAFVSNHLDIHIKRDSPPNSGNAIHPTDATRIEYHI